MPPVIRILLALVLAALPAAPAVAIAQDRVEAAEDAPTFPVEAVNRGLPTLADPPHLGTPQSTLEFFLRASRHEDYARAAHALNLSFVPPEAQPERGPELARKLAHLLATESLIDWGTVPDRPDARIRAIGPEQSSTFARRTIHLGSVSVGGRSVPVNLQRFRLPDGTALWLFSPFTVEHVDEIYAEMGPGLLERRLPRGFGVTVLRGVALWEWGVLAGLLAAAAGLAWLLHKLAVLASRGAGRWPRFSYVLGHVSWPFALTVGAAGFYLAAVRLLPLAGPVSSLVDTAAVLALIASGTWFAFRLLFGLTGEFGTRSVPALPFGHRARQIKTRRSVARRIALVLSVVVGVGLMLAYLGVFDSLGLSLLASAGAFTVLLSFAAYPLLGNLIAGIQIALTEPIRIGDIVEYEGHWSYVEDITFTYVVLRTWTERRLVVPHTYLLNRPLQNWSKRDESITRIVPLFVDHRIDVDALRRRYEEVLQNDERWAGTNLRLEVIDVKEDGVVVWAWVAGPNSSESWSLHNDVREELLKFLQRHEGGRYLPRQRLVVHEGEAGDGAARWRGEAEDEAAGPRRSRLRPVGE